MTKALGVCKFAKIETLGSCALSLNQRVSLRLSLNLQTADRKARSPKSSIRVHHQFGGLLPMQMCAASLLPCHKLLL